ncbi:hypothetical protein BCV70DRAFT_221450 [Testicularia cyperi]|uniref:Amino acid transporter transmembrane domain-containing protein n=1 Tax=Testicularia cyperi TaxID=1882483 RepID=A0A317XH55_9BASI|nr:hypothetical protein BCV70DRAFT_221450 [Testicularia cyperi]
MPTRTSNRGIPVPRDPANGSGRGDQQQAAWRSSLDLVWSYSRSQAFYGNNIATSPSFIESRWAGRDLEGGESIDEDGEDDETDEYDDEDDLTFHSRSGTEAETDAESTQGDGRFGPGELDWEGENVPPNAVSRQRRRSKAQDRRLERLESADENERSRSRSRSPKRLSRASDEEQRREGSRLNPNTGHVDHRQSHHSTASGTSSAAALRDPFADDDDSGHKVSESTPLLTKRGHDETADSRRGNSYGAVRRASSSGVFSIRSDSGYQLQELGTSTFLQSWFNTVNALVGVGILALPLAFSYAGWIGGAVLFLICGLLTNYTGKVLAKIMSKEPSLRTYADIGSYAFGSSARILISLFFCLELWAVSVALIILFGDSMSAIFPDLPPAAFKAIGYVIVLPTVFLPLKFLSPISVIGIVSTFTLVVVVLSDGLIKKDAPGSLWNPSPTSLGPQWDRLPLSFGLIMSGFSSHPVIPSLVRDMKDSSKFPRMLNLAYIAATILYLGMGMIGYAMFGRSVSDEITRDLARTPGFPVALNGIAIWLIVINPLSKFALATRPIQTTFEILLGIDPQTANNFKTMKRRKSSSTRSLNKAHGAKQAVTDRTALDADGTEDMQQQNDGVQSAQLSSSQAQRVSFAAQQLPQRTSMPNGDLLNAHAEEPEDLIPAAGSDNPLAGSAISMRAAKISASLSPRTRKICQIALKVIVTALITGTAIILPGFEKVMAFLGAFLAFATCVFGPLLANLKLFGKDMKTWRIGVDVVILSISAVMAGTGTVWAFLPSQQR